MNTGTAVVGVVGDGAERDYTVLGDTVNVASHIEALAPVGSVAISDATRRAVPGAQSRLARHRDVEDPYRTPRDLAPRRSRRLTYASGNGRASHRRPILGLMPNGWNFADLWECIADRIPDALALQHADRSLTWREMDRRADALAATLLAAGRRRAGQGRALPLQLSEYLESLFACSRPGWRR